MAERIRHCWMGYQEHCEARARTLDAALTLAEKEGMLIPDGEMGGWFRGATCMLPEHGPEVEHEFTSDSNIVVSFTPEAQ